MAYYFIRVNGDTAHNNPSRANCYVPNEPPVYPATFFNYYQYCLDNNVVRIGWPDVGDMRIGGNPGALSKCYTLLKPYEQSYLTRFAQIQPKSVILMPNKANPGELYIGEVTKTYRYYHNIPNDPYECSHRLGVNWDRNEHGGPIVYSANTLGINIHGGWWRWAFYEIQDSVIINNIDNAR